jgi:hypothetical protein
MSTVEAKFAGHNIEHVTSFYGEYGRECVFSCRNIVIWVIIIASLKSSLSVPICSVYRFWDKLRYNVVLMDLYVCQKL